jgi:hypothetical protein
MATLEEKQELLEDIKNPIRYYRILLWGYGGEAAYIGLNKETYEYWEKRKIAEEDTDILLSYMLDEDREDVIDVPAEHDFMSDPDDLKASRYSWYDPPNELTHQCGVSYNSAYMTITEVDSAEYNATPIVDIVDNVSLDTWVNELQEEWDYTPELVDNLPPDADEAEYMLQFYSSEKGTFFEATFASAGKFDPKKLKICTREYFNGDDTVESIYYDNEEVENNGGDASGKGYSVHIWSNV